MKSSVAVYLIKCYCDNNNDFFYINLTTWDWYFFSISSLYSDKPIVNKYCCKVTAINFYTGLFQKNIVVGGGDIEDIHFFEVDFPEFPVKFTVDPPEIFPFCCINSPENPMFFLNFLCTHVPKFIQFST